jgi:hypothetical protein
VALPEGSHRPVHVNSFIDPQKGGWGGWADGWRVVGWLVGRMGSVKGGDAAECGEVGAARCGLVGAVAGVFSLPAWLLRASPCQATAVAADCQHCTTALQPIWRRLACCRACGQVSVHLCPGGASGRFPHLRQQCWWVLGTPLALLRCCSDVSLLAHSSCRLLLLLLRPVPPATCPVPCLLYPHACPACSPAPCLAAPLPPGRLQTRPLT